MLARPREPAFAADGGNGGPEISSTACGVIRAMPDSSEAFNRALGLYSSPLRRSPDEHALTIGQLLIKDDRILRETQFGRRRSRSYRAAP